MMMRLVGLILFLLVTGSAVQAQRQQARDIDVGITVGTDDTVLYWSGTLHCVFTLDSSGIDPRLYGLTFGDGEQLIPRALRIDSAIISRRNYGIPDAASLRVSLIQSIDSVALSIAAGKWEYRSTSFKMFELQRMRSIRLQRYKAASLREYLATVQEHTLFTLQGPIRKKDVRELLSIETGSGRAGSHMIYYTLKGGRQAVAAEILLYDQGTKCSNAYRKQY